MKKKKKKGTKKFKSLLKSHQGIDGKRNALR